MKSFKLLLIGLLPLLTACEEPQPIKEIECFAQTIENDGTAYHYYIETDYYYEDDDYGHYVVVYVSALKRGKHKVGDKLVIGQFEKGKYDNNMGINNFKFLRWVE